MARHSFIQMSKLPNVKGRISYITSHARQENLYATYRTADNEFWSNLARESQQEFKRSGTEGKCIEARELIIALPEVYTKYEPQEVLEDFTEEFHRRYGVECVSALHHNKRKTNYHIHLIFSERKLLPEPDIKIATRSVFYDETGKRVRTKRNAVSICLKDIHFKVEKELLYRTARHCHLKRSTDKFQRSSQVFSPQERLERAKKYLEKNSFMTQADYCQLTGLLKSAASRELREWIANPESGIDYKGRGTHKIYILRKP